jgi:hypothetical protein
MSERTYHITVTGDTGPFKTNQVLTKASDVAKYYRLSVNEYLASPTTLTDQQILEVVNLTQGDDMDAECERVENLATKAMNIHEDRKARHQRALSAA